MTNYVALQSCQSLLLKLRQKGHEIGTATGFVVESRIGPLLLTNRHVVTGLDNDTGKPLNANGDIPDELTIIHNRANKFGEWIETKERLSKPSSHRWIEHPTLGTKADFIALPLTAIDDVQLYPYVLGSNEPAIKFGPSDVISVIGFPFGIQAGGSLAVWATGFVASEPVIEYEGLPVFLVDCRSRSGQSGSAVVLYRSGGHVTLADGGGAMFGGPVCRFLGIYSGRINAESDLGIVWKERAIIELVNSI